MCTFFPDVFPWHIVLKHARTVYNKYSPTPKSVSMTFLGIVRQFFFMQKSWYPRPLYIKFFDTRNFQKHQRLPRRNFSILWDKKIYIILYGWLKLSCPGCLEIDLFSACVSSNKIVIQPSLLLLILGCQRLLWGFFFGFQKIIEINQTEIRNIPKKFDHKQKYEL